MVVMPDANFTKPKVMFKSMISKIKSACFDYSVAEQSPKSISHHMPTLDNKKPEDP